ncbi:MAG: YbhB/YbcL family Raf kinase inhibitor-like protein [Candidatus Eisenbacteria bacterium]|uniref:YbhB/YbcL family Raf kinase inhibitor-like protein n=1 Tax=Eiseniibacteriota bacterium TaxID=2212470 RepID=A0A538U7F6_UNCEI|nr:MAG: YbhB/YbcL family Raf kinase inhibitor-like protein [Candidatus Eisenbacteria bacterium]
MLKAFGITLLAATTSAAHPARTGLVLTSTDVHVGRTMSVAQVYDQFGCTGKNESPSLQWRGAPARTKSFAVTLYDPDAPTGSGWWHWVVYDLPANANRLATGAGKADGSGLPAGAVQGTTDFGTRGYGGPCPPKGDKPHRYVFTLYALDTDKIEVPANATAAMVGFNLHAHQLAKATLVARYGR